MILVAVLTQQRAATPSPSAWGTLPAGSAGGESAPHASQPSRGATGAPAHDATTRPRGPGNAGSASSGPGATGHRGTATVQTGLPAAKPIEIRIPAIHVDAAVFAIGKDSHGGLQVPQPGPNLNKVAWYKFSPTPGQIGPAVLEGHVDSVQGPSVFLHLGALTPGDLIKVVRADQSVAVFTVDGVRAYKSHGDFPTDLVYSGDLNRATLRIITCSNFDHDTGHYVGNTIVFAHLTAAHGR